MRRIVLACIVGIVVGAMASYFGLNISMGKWWVFTIGVNSMFWILYEVGRQ